MVSICTVVGKSKWYHQVFQGSFHLKRQAVPLNLTWVDLAFSCTKGYPGRVKRHSLPFQVEAVLKCLVIPLTFAHDCTSKALGNGLSRVKRERRRKHIWCSSSSACAGCHYMPTLAIVLG